jgi:hypothetical protein
MAPKYRPAPLSGDATESSCLSVTLKWNTVPVPRVENQEDLTDRTTRCPNCEKRIVPVVTLSGRTVLQCMVVTSRR